MSNKSYVGADKVYYALVTQDDADGYVADTPSYLAPVINLSQAPKSNNKVQYADNQSYDSATNEGETEIEVELTGMSLQTQAILTGKVYDVATGRMFDHGGTPPYIAIGCRAKRSGGGYRYFWFLKCTPQPPAEEASSETDTPDFKSSKMKFTAIRTIYQWELIDSTLTDSAKRVVGDTEDTNFVATTWYDNVQVPVAGTAPSLTATPSPADAATGVAVGIAPTITFSNALRTGVLGILLTADDGTIVDSAYTIDAANKVVTITPDSDLSSSTTYLISVAARDVYGQTLRAVYDFTTT